MLTEMYTSAVVFICEIIKVRPALDVQNLESYVENTECSNYTPAVSR